MALSFKFKRNQGLKKKNENKYYEERLNHANFKNTKLPTKQRE